MDAKERLIRDLIEDIMRVDRAFQHKYTECRRERLQAPSLYYTKTQSGRYAIQLQSALLHLSSLMLTRELSRITHDPRFQDVRINTARTGGFMRLANSYATQLEAALELDGLPKNGDT